MKKSFFFLSKKNAIQCRYTLYMCDVCVYDMMMVYQEKRICLCVFCAHSGQRVFVAVAVCSCVACAVAYKIARHSRARREMYKKQQ